MAPAAAFRIRVLADTPSTWSAWAATLADNIAPGVTTDEPGEIRRQRWTVDPTRLEGSAGAVVRANAPADMSAQEVNTRWILFVDSPARFIAAHMSLDHTSDAHALLRAWQAAAKRALARIHLLHGQCMVFDSDEAASSLPSVAQCVSGWLGVELPEEGWVAPRDPDPLLLRLSQELVQADRGSMAQWAEVQACCSPLPQRAQALRAGTSSNTGNLLAEVRVLMARAALVPSLQSRLDELQAQHSEMTRTAAAQAVDGRAEAELLLAQLHQVQEELESLAVQQRQSLSLLDATQAELRSSRQDASELRRQLELDCRHGKQLRGQLDAAKGDLDALKVQLRAESLRCLELERARESDRESIEELQTRLKSEEYRLGQAHRLADQALAQQAELTLAAEAKADDARVEAERLLAQLRQVQEELDSLSERQRQSLSSLDAAQAVVRKCQQDADELRRQIREERQQNADFSGQLATIKTHLETERLRADHLESHSSALSQELQESQSTLAQERDQRQSEFQSLTATIQAERFSLQKVDAEQLRMASARADAAAMLTAEAHTARLEADILRLQLLHAQEELDLNLLKLEKVEQVVAAAVASPQAHVDGSGLIISARRVRVGLARTQRPHRELNLEFDEVTLGKLTMPCAMVRLVEHEGRAGLALLVPPEQTSPITQWQPDGEDDGRAFVLFVPSEARCRDRLAQLGTKNWHTLMGMAALVREVVTSDTNGVDSFWETVAKRLWAELHALPARLRYDDLNVQLDGESVSLRLDGACFGSSVLPPVALRWTPGSADAPLRWLLTDEHTPCLAAWPTRADGTLVPELVLPLRSQGTLGSRLRWWAMLVSTDRDLLLAVMDTLAAAPEHLSGQVDEAQRTRLTREAARLQAGLRRTLNLGRVARRLRRTV